MNIKTLLLQQYNETILKIGAFTAKSAYSLQPLH